MLLIELLLIGGLIPTLLFVNLWAPYLFAFLWGLTGYTFLVYRIGYFESYRALWNWDAVNRATLKPVLLRWLLASIAMLLFIAWYDPERVFYLPLHAPHVIPWIVLVYPVLSALPQEFIFCSFFFKRYEPFFGAGLLMVFASALVFAYAHMMYINPVAPTLSFLGGLIFAQTFLKTRSLSLVTIEHSLYGITLFMSGLGWYFYSGNVGG